MFEYPQDKYFVAFHQKLFQHSLVCLVHEHNTPECCECVVLNLSQNSAPAVSQNTVRRAGSESRVRVRGRGCAVRAAVLTERGGLESEQTEHTLTLADRTVQSGRTLRAAGLRTDGTAARKVSKA